MLKGRKRPVIFKDGDLQCPHCESMGWRFGAEDDKPWSSFLEMCLIENVEELVFSFDSIFHPQFESRSREAETMGLRLALWLCGHERHRGVAVEQVKKLAASCAEFYPLVANASEMHSLRNRWGIKNSPLFLIFHEQRLNSTLKLFESELRQDLFPVWGVFPERDLKRRVGVSPEKVHRLYFKTRGKRMGQGLTPLPGLEHLGVRREHIEDIEPQKVNIFINKARPQFSVIMPAFGDKAQLALVMDALLRLEGDYEVVFVDEGNAEDLEEFFSGYVARGMQGSFIRLAWTGEPGDKNFRAGRARNLGAKYARGEIFCFLDSDILLKPDYLRVVGEALKKHDVVQAKRLNLISGRSAISTEEKDLLPLGSYWEKFYASAAVDWNSMKHPWKYICTHSLSLSRALFFEVGGFSSLFNSYGYEDTEFGFRCFQKGKGFGLLATEVFHLARPGEEIAHKSSHLVRHSGLKNTGGLFMRNSWDHEVFSHCHYLFDVQRAKWSRIQALSRDLFKTVRRDSHSVSG